MEAGTPASELHDKLVLYLDAVSLELRVALRRWQASPLRITGGAWEGGKAFLQNMKRTLSATLVELEQTHEPARET